MSNKLDVIKTALALLSLIISFIISFDNNVLSKTGITPDLRHPQKITGYCTTSFIRIITLSSRLILYFKNKFFNLED